MKPFRPLPSLLSLLSLLAFTLAACAPPAPLAAQLHSEALPVEGFARAEGIQPFEFPRDFGPHPDYQTEWWYYTGNLDTADGRHFGYQFTIFRRGLLPASQSAERPSAWAADQLYFAHFALTDVSGEAFYFEERFERGAAGLAGAQAAPYSVWLADWQVEETVPGVVRLQARGQSFALDLTLTDEKGPILQGQQGYSQKGPEPGNASYYYSQPRLESTGQIEINGESFEVSGLSWKDHEFSTSALSPGQIGWDWFSLQLSDGTDLMLYTMRRADGSIDSFSHGTLIHPDGQAEYLPLDQYTITVLDTWTSPHSGAVYPAAWQIDLPAYDLALTLQPWQADQELRLSFIYWEGAVKISGSHNSQPLTGNGYVELTGYYASMEGEF